VTCKELESDLEEDAFGQHRPTKRRLDFVNPPVDHLIAWQQFHTDILWKVVELVQYSGNLRRGKTPSPCFRSSVLPPEIRREN
jgi:hypothetical protein